MIAVKKVKTCATDADEFEGLQPSWERIEDAGIKASIGFGVGVGKGEVGEGGWQLSYRPECLIEIRTHIHVQSSQTHR